MKRLLALVAMIGLSTLTVRAEFLFSPDVPTTLGPVTYVPWDIVRNDSGTYSLVLSLPPGTGIDGLHRMNSGGWLFSVGSSAVLGGTTFDPRDVVRYDGVGTYTLYFSGATAGVPAGSNVDTVFLDGGDAGDLVLSFDVPTTIGASTYDPADLVRFSAGAFSLFFDASATTPPIPISSNVTGAGRRGTRTFLTFDVPTTLGAATYLPGQIVTWDGTRFAPFSVDAAWPISSRVNALSLGTCLDGDGDGFGAPGDPSCRAGGLTDCDDTAATVYPAAPQLCDGINNDCSDPSWPTRPANEAAADGDGRRICAGDCLDTNAAVYPGAPQVCDGVNNDCAYPGWPTLVGTNEFDDDGDGRTECAGDCLDTNPAVYPGAPQVCDGVNNDCANPAWPALTGTNEFDDDGDGRTECAGDCIDTNAAVYPGAPQICDGVNNDCTYPGWPTLAGTNEFDDDGDGFTECGGDCTDANGSVWGTPGEVSGLTLTTTTLSWTAPDAGGSPALLVYDTIRSTNRNDFVTTPPTTCVESNDGPNATASDPGVPPLGTVFYYLIRAQNPCPGVLGVGSLGTTSGGVQRTARDCP